MTKKDYTRIANVINGATILKPYNGFDFGLSNEEIFLAGSKDQVKHIGRVMADMLAQDNPRFDRARFLKACGITGE